MHGSRMSAHDQGAEAQTRHSIRRHTVPDALHDPRARNIPSHMLGSSRLTATHARSDAPCSLCPSPAPETE
eukprot:7376401-Prymnesium_polylepis.1